MTTEPSLLDREKYCEELDSFIEDTENFLKDICSNVGWSFDSIDEENNEKYITCPFNEGHRVPERTIQKHLKSCEWKTLGYTKDCVPLPEPALPPGAPSTIKFDMHLQHEVLQKAKQKNPELNIGIDEKFVPQTSDRLVSDFTSDERKAMYEYVIANTVGPDIGYDITEMNKPDKSNESTKSTPILELLAQERNLKRRRAKHRGVHTNKKSRTEIMREIVQQQMEMYKEHISEKFGIPIPGDIEENNSVSTNDKNVEPEHKNSEVDFDKCSVHSFSKHDHEKNIDEDNRFHQYKNQHNSKNFNEKSERNYENYDKEHNNTSHKHSSHYKDHNYKNSSRDWNSQYSSRNHYCRENERDKNDSWNRDKYDSYNSNRDKSDSRDRNRDKNYDNNYFPTTSDFQYSDTQEIKFNDNVSRSRKRDRSKSNERKQDKEPRHRSKEQKSHKKHKKEHKNKRDRSHDYDDSRKHKKSKHKRDRYRSKSRSRECEN